MKRSAVFFVYVWPEPASSAAGIRTLALMRALLTNGWRVTAVSPSSPSVFAEALEAIGVETCRCDPNESSNTESALAALTPELVIYDRFVMEEQFGWRARVLWPDALHVVDTQDLHSVRRARERLAAAGASWERLAAITPADGETDLLRELASLYRADLALVVSEWEQKFLLNLGLPPLHADLLSFPAAVAAAPAPFSECKGFAFLGNFRHAPNLDGARWLVETLWPVLREKLPAAELHLYGSYPPSEISRHRGVHGIFAHGHIADHRAALARHRVLVAPLRFGAGIKGKVLEAFGTGTPALGSPIAFEGLGSAGVEFRDAQSFASAALALHEEEGFWNQEQAKGLKLVQDCYDEEKLAKRFLKLIEERRSCLAEHRCANLIGAMLRLQGNNSTKYFSKWIEAKNSPHSKRG